MARLEVMFLEEGEKPKNKIEATRSVVVNNSNLKKIIDISFGFPDEINKEYMELNHCYKENWRKAFALAALLKGLTKKESYNASTKYILTKKEIDKVDSVVVKGSYDFSIKTLAKFSEQISGELVKVFEGVSGKDVETGLGIIRKKCDQFTAVLSSGLD